MIFCHISDTHNRHKKITIPSCDVLIHSGDCTGQGTEGEFKEFMKWWNRQAAPFKVLIAGNHDRCFDEKFWEYDETLGLKAPPTWFFKIMGEYTKDFGNHYLLNRLIDIQGVKIYGSPQSKWFHGEKWAFNLKEEDAEGLYKNIPQCDILVTHGPAYGKLDLALPNKSHPLPENTGSLALMKKIEEIKPKYHLFGHIHEDYGTMQDEFTVYSNGSICNLQYQPVNQPFIFEI